MLDLGPWIQLSLSVRLDLGGRAVGGVWIVTRHCGVEKTMVYRVRMDKRPVLENNELPWNFCLPSSIGTYLALWIQGWKEAGPGVNQRGNHFV